MPFKSESQRKFFGMCKGNPGKSKLKCPPKKVINKFFREDRKAKGK